MENKYKEALSRLKGMTTTSPFSDEKSDIDYNDLKKCDTQLQNDYLHDLSILEELINKETLDEPYLEADGYWDGNLVYDTWICPHCEARYEVGCDEYDYCPNCGQHLNWEFEEEEYE